jgi:hypothetical protein
MTHATRKPFLFILILLAGSSGSTAVFVASAMLQISGLSTLIGSVEDHSNAAAVFNSVSMNPPFIGTLSGSSCIGQCRTRLATSRATVHNLHN